MTAKIKINKKIKKSLIIFLVISSGIFLFLQYKERSSVKSDVQEKTVFSYKTESPIDYKVHIIENPIYNTNVLPSDGIYITSLIKNIEIGFSHTFQGVRNCEISGSYDITASVKGTIGKDKGNILWTKNFQLKPTTKFSGNDGKLSVKDSVLIDYHKYNNLCKELNSFTGVSTDDTLYITMNIKYDILTDKGTAKEQFSPTLSIPLDKNYFNINKINMDEKAGEIKKQVTVTLMPNRILILLYTIIGIISIILAAVIIFFTEEPDKKDIYRKKIKKIFKNYGIRLVAITDEILTDESNRQNVRSMDDLIKISDELEKPILYVYKNDILEIKSFYVLADNSFVYTVDCPEIPIEQPVQNEQPSSE